MTKYFTLLVLFLALSPALPTLAASGSLKELIDSGVCGGDAAHECAGHFVAVHGCGRESVERGLKKEIEEFATLAEQALALRAETIKTGMLIKGKLEKGKPLTGQDLALMNQGVIEHMELRARLLGLAEAHECWLDASAEELGELGVTPESRLKAVMLSLSSALVLYDNYLLSISLFEGNQKLRRILNEQDPGYAVRRAELAKITMNYNSISNRKRVRHAMQFYEKEIKKLGAFSSDTREMEYLSTLIMQSPSYNMVKKWSHEHPAAFPEYRQHRRHAQARGEPEGAGRHHRPGAAPGREAVRLQLRRGVEGAGLLLQAGLPELQRHRLAHQEITGAHHLHPGRCGDKGGRWRQPRTGELLPRGGPHDR